MSSRTVEESVILVESLKGRKQEHYVTGFIELVLEGGVRDRQTSREFI